MTSSASPEPDEDELAAQLAEMVTRVARRLRRNSARMLEPLGLSDGQARVLRTIARARSPLRMSEIARWLDIDPRSATSVIDGLESKGLVAREIDPADRRSFLLRPTPEGTKLAGRLRHVRVRSAADYFAHLAPKERIELLHLLVALDDHSRAERASSRAHRAASRKEGSPS